MNELSNTSAVITSQPNNSNKSITCGVSVHPLFRNTCVSCSFVAPIFASGTGSAVGLANAGCATWASILSGIAIGMTSGVICCTAVQCIQNHVNLCNSPSLKHQEFYSNSNNETLPIQTILKTTIV